MSRRSAGTLGLAGAVAVAAVVANLMLLSQGRADDPLGRLTPRAALTGAQGARTTAPDPDASATRRASAATPTRPSRTTAPAATPAPTPAPTPTAAPVRTPTVAPARTRTARRPTATPPVATPVPPAPTHTETPDGDDDDRGTGTDRGTSGRTTGGDRAKDDHNDD